MSLHQRGTGRAAFDPSSIEDAPGAQATTLEVGEQALTDGAFSVEPSQSPRACFVPSTPTPNATHSARRCGHRRAGHQIQLVRLGQLRGGLGDKPAADGDAAAPERIAAGAHAAAVRCAAAVDRLGQSGRSGAVRTRGRRIVRPPRTRYGPGPRRRAVGLVRVARPADRRPILFERAGPVPTAPQGQLRFGVNQQLDERQPSRRFNTGGRTDCFMAAPLVRRFASCITSSEEPPLPTAVGHLPMATAPEFAPNASASARRTEKLTASSLAR